MGDPTTASTRLGVDHEPRSFMSDGGWRCSACREPSCCTAICACRCMVPDRLSIRQMEQMELSSQPRRYVGRCHDADGQRTGVLRCELGCERTEVAREDKSNSDARPATYVTICETPEQHSASAIVCYTILGHTSYSGPRVSGGLGIRALHRPPSRAVPPQRDTRKIALAARRRA